MNKEIEAMRKHNVWDLIDTDDVNGNDVVTCRWVFSNKENIEDTKLYKAR